LNAERAAQFELRLADRITAFAGSMKFVYLHALAFALWMLVVERSPWPTLTLAVSLEAIFLTSFVMIGQNRQATFQQAKADHDFVEEVQELKLNTELTREIHELTASSTNTLASQDKIVGTARDKRRTIDRWRAAGLARATGRAPEGAVARRSGRTPAQPTRPRAIVRRARASVSSCSCSGSCCRDWSTTTPFAPRSRR
jgi:uncharacterized membrane protein